MGDDDLEAQQEGALVRTVSHETIKGRRNSRASSKAVGLVFLSAWALFGIGSLSGSESIHPANPARSTSTPQGTVLSRPYNSGSIDLDSQSYSPLTTIDFVIDSDPTPSPLPDRSEYHQQSSEADPPSSERILGRISAWTCTTLYLTSRLPQIWKNVSLQSSRTIFYLN